MKAIDIIVTLFSGWLDLEQGGVFTLHEDDSYDYARGYFMIARVVRGDFLPGKYMYFYAPEGLKLADEEEPDVIITTKLTQTVLLWKIE